MKWGPHFKLFEKLQSKHLKSRLGPLILIIVEKKYKIFDKRSN